MDMPIPDGFLNVQDKPTMAKAVIVGDSFVADRMSKLMTADELRADHEAWVARLNELNSRRHADTPQALSGGKLTGDHYYRVKVEGPMSAELAPYVAECADIIEALGMTFNEGEAFKAIWRLAASRQGRGKPGNKAQYDADKAAHYGQRIAACVKREGGAA